MVGQQTLNLLIGVRVPTPQPFKKILVYLKMRKEYAGKARNRLHNHYQNLTIQGFTSKHPETLRSVQWVISCATNFDSGMGQDLKNAWEIYKSTGFNAEQDYQNFMEWVYKLDADLDTYFKSEWISTVVQTEDQKYINDEIQKKFQSKTGEFNYQKLITLIEEINFNYSNNKVYASCMLLRAILDHIPPLLARKTFEEVVNYYSWGTEKSSPRKAMKDLLAFRNTPDDVLHGQISNKSEVIDISYLPNKFAINTLLVTCLDSNIKLMRQQSVNQQSGTMSLKKVKTPDHYPAVEVIINQSGGQPYTISLSFVNTGDKPAILEELYISEELKVNLNTQNMLPANNTPRQFGGLSLEGYKIRTEAILKPQLVITYRDMAGIRYKTTYRILTKQRADKQYNVEGLADLNIEVLG